MDFSDKIGERRKAEDRKKKSTQGWRIDRDPDREAAQHVLIRCENCNAKLYDVLVVEPSYREEHYKVNCPACGDSSPLTTVVGEQVSGPAFDEESDKPRFRLLAYNTVDKHYHKITLGKL